MSDIVERLRDSDTTRRIGESYADVHESRQRDRDEAADDITKLRAEVETWQRHAKLAIWSDSEECKLLTADNERLRAALSELYWAVDNACTGEAET